MLQLHHSQRADALVEPLAAVLAQPPEDAFSVDVVAVPTRGVERWLAQRLSHRLGSGPDDEAGVCANVTFGSPSRLVADVLAAVVGVAPQDDPWEPRRLLWPLLEVIDECTHDPWCTALGRHLGADDDEIRRGRRLVIARHLAILFASYAAQRPWMIRAWAEGADDDGAGGPVPADLAWQPELWRRVRERIGMPSPAERLAAATATLAADPGAVGLPARLSVFGATRLPEDQLEVLHALSRHRDVHLWLHHPSPVLWERVTATAPQAYPLRRRDNPIPAAHALLASMARDAVELQVRLTALDGTTAHHHPAPPPARSLLGALQRRLLDDSPDAGTPHHLVDTTDRSVQVHACHGRARQVEVLRETLVGLLADDPTLEPRDVIVMCPDIEAVAPLVAATFGLAPEVHGPEDSPGPHPGRTLRVRLADRSLRQTNPLLSVLSALLELADSRVTASQVLDLAATPPVRRRFRFDDDDLERLRQWAVTAGVRWAENAGRRARFGLNLPQGTWDTALDRILLGAAMAEEDHRFIGSALPMDDVDSTDIDLAGRLAELVDRLSDVLSELDGVRPLSAWLATLDGALDRLTDVAPSDGWQAVEARGLLADVRSTGERDGLPLRLTDVRALLAGRLEGRPTRAGFRTGALTMCSLEPMRAVPHRVVCLLGLDDGAFPRATGTDGDDVLLREPLLGERDRRSEDRQLFLDAVSAAQDNLVVLYSGADERTGALRPPAVPVGELLDALDRTAVTAEGGPVREDVLVRHPLQTVDERNFTAGALHRSGPFAFDAVSHRAALAGRGPRVGRRPFLSEPLPPLLDPSSRDDGDAGTVDLDGLIAVLEHPVRGLVRQRLEVTLRSDVEDVEDALPLELDALQTWAIGDRLLAARLAGADPLQAKQAEWRRGEVPPGALGRTVLDDVLTRIEPVAAAAATYAVGPARSLDVTATLPDGRAVVGTVGGLHGDVLLRAVYSKLAPKHRLRAWVQLLTLAAARPDRPWTAVTVGRAQGSRPTATTATLAAPAPEWARARLAELVEVRDTALREPLPAPVVGLCAYATSRAAGDPEVAALAEARAAWDGSRVFPGEGEDPAHTLVWGAGTPLRDVVGEPSATERAWGFDDSTRLGVLARRVWEPLLAHETRATG